MKKEYVTLVEESNKIETTGVVELDQAIQLFTNADEYYDWEDKEGKKYDPTRVYNINKQIRDSLSRFEALEALEALGIAFDGGSSSTMDNEKLIAFLADKAGDENVAKGLANILRDNIQ